MQILVVASSRHSAALRALIDSVHRQVRDPAITVLITDPRAGQADATGQANEGDPVCLVAAGLRIDGFDYRDVWMAGGAAFARWAVIPVAVRTLDVDGAVLVLPEHGWVTGPLDDLDTLVGRDELGLFPEHVDTASGVRRGGWITEMALVGSSSAPILGTWEQLAGNWLRTARPDEFIDAQRPWDRFVDGGEALRSIDDAAMRLGPDNADSITLAIDDITGSFTADAAPLRLARFDGFDPSAPWWYAPLGATEPRALTSTNPALRALCRAYADALEASDDPMPPQRPPDVVGIRLTPELHAAFRARLADPHQVPAPNPLRVGEVAGFVDWLRGPGTSDGTGVNLAADLVWATRPDLARAFPHVRWGDRTGFVRWLWTHGLDEGLVTASVLPPLSELTAPPKIAADPARRFGVNLIGYHDAELGLGVAVRRIGHALDAAKIPWTKVTYDRTHSRRRDVEGHATTVPYWFNLVLIAPDQLDFFVGDVGPDLFAGRYNIGLWYWETDVMRPSQVAAFGHLDEVWAATSYLREIFAAHSDKPVTLVPIPLEFDLGTPDPSRRQRLGLDDRFTFLFSFDFLSIVERKNPLDLITAFERAFTPDDGARLILKSINGDLHVRQREQIRDAIADRDDIELWDRYLDAADRIALVAEVDCYVSLHRSEGLGLTMAEAMAAGTPVIATGYSGNLDFMTPGSSLLVRSKEIEIGEGSFYPAEGHWAQPDLDHAVELMRQVSGDTALREQLAIAGRAALRPFTVGRVAQAIRDQLRAIFERC